MIEFLAFICALSAREMVELVVKLVIFCWLVRLFLKHCVFAPVVVFLECKKKGGK